jgi:ketosteroid isomerase-like protein
MLKGKEVKELTMTTQRTIDEVDIRRRMDKWAEAIRAVDLDGVTSNYAPDIASFDLGPPLRHVGAQAKRKNWAEVFAMFQHPVDYEIRDLTITMGDDVAFGHSLNRISGTSKDGKKIDVWVRFTACFRKMDSIWLIVHDHVSVGATWVHEHVFKNAHGHVGAVVVRFSTQIPLSPSSLMTWKTSSSRTEPATPVETTGCHSFWSSTKGAG